MIGKRILFSPKTVVQYLLLWFAFVFHESLLVRNNTHILEILAILTIVFTIVVYKRTRNMQIGLLLLLLLTNVIFVRLINSGGIGISIWVLWLIDIYSIYAAYKVDTDRFIDRYVKLITIYAFVSVVCTFVFWTAPGVWNTITPVHYYDVVDYHIPYKGYLFLHIVGLHYDKLRRNCGIFPEPGLYQIPLNTALYFLLIFKERILMKKRHYCFALFFICSALVTAKTTSGYIAMIAIFIAYCLMSGFSTKLKFILVSVVVIVAVMMDYALNGADSILYSVIISKVIVNNRIDFSSGTGSYRLKTIPHAIQIIIENPLGAGYDKYKDYFIRNNLDLNMFAGMGLVRAFAYYGLAQTVIMYVFLVKSAYKRKKNLVHFFLVIFLYINTLVAQTDIFYPSLIILFFIDHEKNKDIDIKKYRMETRCKTP